MGFATFRRAPVNPPPLRIVGWFSARSEALLHNFEGRRQTEMQDGTTEPRKARPNLVEVAQLRESHWHDYRLVGYAECTRAKN